MESSHLIFGFLGCFRASFLVNKLDDLLNLAIDVVLCLGWVHKLNAG